MGIISFGFTKIDAEKKGVAKGGGNVNSNVQIKDVKDSDISFGSKKESGIKIDFEYSAKFNQNIGHVILEGSIIFMDDIKKIKEIKDSFKKSKKLPDKVMGVVLNTILARSNIEALLISRELNLPPTMPMPRVQKK